MSFEQDIANAFAGFQDQHDQIMRGATQRVMASLVRLTPVAEGEAVADWDVDIGRAPVDTEQPADQKKTKTRARLRAQLTDVKMGDVVIFQNDDPVILQLERGYSAQAPQGMARLTVRRWKSFVRGEALAASKRVAKRLAEAP